MDKMSELDIGQFWKDDAAAHLDNCFNPEAGQAALGIGMAPECIYAELDLPGHPWDVMPDGAMREHVKRYNDKAEAIVGRRLLPEEYPAPASRFPYFKRVGDIFGGKYVMHDHSEWLMPGAESPDELEKLLDRVEKMDIADFVIPANWGSEVKRIREETGVGAEAVAGEGHFMRGPVTLATSIMGSENFLLLYYDAPELFSRFAYVLADVAIKRADAIDEACGYAAAGAAAGAELSAAADPAAGAGVSGPQGGARQNRRGYQFNDDNCCLMTPEMYEIFGYHVLKTVFARFAPDESDFRYQHSDSDMRHLLPILGRVNLTGCNLGPNVLVDDIRRHMPTTRIDGCIDPFAFSRNEEAELVRQVKRDCEAARASGTRGLNISTAGSINYGSSLKSLRLIMQAIQNYGRY